MSRAGRAEFERALWSDAAADLDALERDVTETDVVAYHHGELSGERAEAVERLLSADPVLAQTLLELRDPAALAQMGAASSATKSEVDAGWKDLAARLGETSEGDAGGTVHEFPVAASSPLPARRSSPGMRWAVAAALVVGAALATLVATYWTRGPEPTGDVRIVQLEPRRPDAGPLRGGGDEAPVVHTGEPAEIVLMLWAPLDRAADLPDRTTAQIYDGETLVRESTATLRDGAYATRLGDSGLERGTYQIRLVDDAGGEVASYRLTWD